MNVFVTCPSTRDVDGQNYRLRLTEVARWSDETGCTGVAVGMDDDLLDPWLVAQSVVEETSEAVPIVEVRPAFQHPFSVAKAVSTIGNIHGRRAYVNLVPGDDSSMLSSLGDTTRPADWNGRLREFGLIVSALLAGDGPVTLQGDFYDVTNLRLAPAQPEDLDTRLFAFSDAADIGDVAADIGATPMRSLHPFAEPAPSSVDSALRLGIIARESADTAVRAAQGRFPNAFDANPRPVGVEAGHGEPAMWIEKPEADGCSYIVGSYRAIAHDLGPRVRRVADLVLDTPKEASDLHHAMAALSVIDWGQT